MSQEEKEIEYYKASIASEFTCLAENCPMNCCGNWNIAYDSETYKHIVKEPGALGRKLRFFSTYHKELNCFSIHHVFGRCPYYRKKLCDLQYQGREDCMPLVCRLYPRRTVSYGKRCEMTLELSCIHAAELLLEKSNVIPLAKVEEPFEIFWEQSYPDQSFLQFLLDDRKNILFYWWQVNLQNLPERGEDSEASDRVRHAFVESLRDIYRYVYAEYMWIVRDRLEEAQKLTLPMEEIDRVEIMAPRIGKKKLAFSFYPVKFINSLIYDYLDYQGMLLQNTKLYFLIRQYQKQFGKVLETEADATMIQEYEAMVHAQPDLHRSILTYYSYLVTQTYCEALEDYYILGPILLAALFTEFLMIFFIVEFKANGCITTRRQAEIISCMEKSLRHKNALADNFLEEIRKTYFDSDKK